METVSLVSINRAEALALRVGKTTRRTGHFKHPHAGAVFVDSNGIAGDFIGNQKHHGGPDQAVYLYSAADNDWWQPLLGKANEPGFFGENLTIGRWWPDARVGDRLRCGDLLLELTGPRTPCATLEARAQVPGLSRQFIKAERCGAYARVIEPGNAVAGGQCQIIRAPASSPTIIEVFRYWHAKGEDPVFLETALAAPLASRIADRFRFRLASCQTPQIN